MYQSVISCTAIYCDHYTFGLQYQRLGLSFVYTVCFGYVGSYEPFNFMCYASALSETTVTVQTVFNQPKVTATRK